MPKQQQSRHKVQPKQKRIEHARVQAQQAARTQPRNIEYMQAFGKDFKKLKKGVYKDKLDKLLEARVDLLKMDRPLPQNAQDHPLKGNWLGYRDCHLAPDVVLIYRKPDDTLLQLVRLGSHSELSF
jgi:mRNA interferase YafQ